MIKLVSLLFTFLIVSSSFAQNGTIVVKKTKPDTLNIIGQWIRTYDKKANGTIVKIEKSIDTINYYPDHTCLVQEDGSRQSSKWQLDQKNKIIHLKNINFTMTLDGQIIDEHFESSEQYIGKVENDTLTLLDYSDSYPELILYNTRYYYRKK